MSTTLRIFAIAALATFGLAGAAMAQNGPVATACKDEIAKYCAGKEHGHREVRECLEAQKEKVSKECKTALETTGHGKGMGKGMGMEKGVMKPAPESKAAPEAAPAPAPEAVPAPEAGK